MVAISAQVLTAPQTASIDVNIRPVNFSHRLAVQGNITTTGPWTFELMVSPTSNPADALSVDSVSINGAGSINLVHNGVARFAFVRATKDGAGDFIVGAVHLVTD